MIDKRDAFIAQLGRELGILSEAVLARAQELRKRTPGKPLEQLLEEAGLLPKEAKSRLAHEFNARVRAMQSKGAKPSQRAPAPPSTRAPQQPPAPSGRSPAASARSRPAARPDESGAIVPDAADRSLLRPAVDPLATPPSEEGLLEDSDLGTAKEDEILAEPTIMLPDDELRAGPKPKAPPPATKQPPPKKPGVSPVVSEDELLAEPTMMLPDEELRAVPKAKAKHPPKKPGVSPVVNEDELLAEPTMMLPDEELKAPPRKAEPKLLPVSDEGPTEDEILSEPTIMVPDDELRKAPEPRLLPASEEQELEMPEDELLSEPTIMVPDDELKRVPARPAAKSEEEILAEPTLVVPDEPLRLKDDSSEQKAPDLAIPDELKVASGPHEALAPGVKGKRSGKLDRKEFERRSKLRMSFEGLRLGDYEVVGELSRGAFGVVLKVRPEGQARQLAKERGFTAEFMAMKVMLETNDPEETRRFMDEVKVLIGLVHPNIVRIFDAGVDGGLKFYTMEMIEGVDSRTLVREQGGKLPYLYAARIAKDVAAALASVHAKTIYHRDLKPANVMIDRASQPYRTVLIDFGLVVDKNEKDSGLVMGTPSYMPPEQAKPKGGFGEVNATSDIYSLGATFYFLMTGIAPFPGKDPREIIKRVVSEPPPLPSSLNAEIPKSIEAICMKCLAKPQRERFAAAWQLEKELEKELSAAQLKLKAKGFMRKIFGGGGSAPPKT